MNETDRQLGEILEALHGKAPEVIEQALAFNQIAVGIWAIISLAITIAMLVGVIDCVKKAIIYNRSEYPTGAGAFGLIGCISFFFSCRFIWVWSCATFTPDYFITLEVSRWF